MPRRNRLDQQGFRIDDVPIAHSCPAVPRSGRAGAGETHTGDPSIDDVVHNGRVDVISVGFVLSLWSGSRALNVFVDTISIMYGQSGVRGIVRTRALSFSLYLLALVVGVVVIPLVLIGPSLLAELLPERVQFLRLPHAVHLAHDVVLSPPVPSGVRGRHVHL